MARIHASCTLRAGVWAPAMPAQSIARQAAKSAAGFLKAAILCAATLTSRRAIMPDGSGHDRLSCRVQHPMQARPDASEAAALIALVAGALAIGSSGIFVRLSETGPTATAFWRGAFALPLLAVWAGLERRARAGAAQPEAMAMARGWRDPMFFWAGVFFAGDLALWHASLLLTSVAASTLEANCAPLIVTLGAWALWGERPRLSFLLALALGSVGLLLIV